jgi:hypothetical protein
MKLSWLAAFHAAGFALAAAAVGAHIIRIKGWFQTRETPD